jgi:hypothetical protein
LILTSIDFYTMVKKGQASGLRSRDDTKGSDGSSGQARHRDKSRKVEDRASDSDESNMETPPPPSATDAKIDSMMAMLTARLATDDRRDAQLTQLVVKFEAQFAAHDARAAKVEGTIAAVIARLDASEKLFPSLVPGASSASTSSNSRWGAPPTPAASRSPTRSMPDAAPELTKVFFDGASHALHKAVLGRYWNDTVRPLVPPNLTANTRAFIGNSAVFSIGFPSETAALDFLAAIKDKSGAPTLIDTDGHHHTMTANLQRSKVPTKFGKRLSPVFQHYQAKLCLLPGWLSDFKLVPDPHRGRLYIEKGEKLIFLHTLDAGGTSLITYDEGLADFSLDIVECRAAALLFAAAP